MTGEIERCPLTSIWSCLHQHAATCDLHQPAAWAWDRGPGAPYSCQRHVGRVTGDVFFRGHQSHRSHTHTHICVCVCVFCRKISDNCEGITFFSFGWCYIQLPFCPCWFSIDGFAKQFCVLAKFSDFKEVSIRFVPANRHWNKQQCTLTLVSLNIKYNEILLWVVR